MSVKETDDSGWRRIAFYFLVTVASVIAPGTIIIGCLIVVTGQQAPITALAAATGSQAGESRFFVILAGLSSAYLVGYVARYIGFVAFRWLTSRGGSQSTIGEFREEIVERLGSTTLQTTTGVHPHLRESLEVLDDRTPLIHDTLNDAFVYSKLWLRRYAPVLNIDSMEFEINVLAACYVPTMCFAGAVMVQDVGLVGRLAVVVIFAMIVGVITHNLRDLRVAERKEAYRNIILDVAMRSAAK
ncbi:hypothetical protein [Terracoccus luteus]|uniref:hypothetical protein n=1 Tax=Terracoccus luteus TaxID=53356 RepID=UPI0011C47A5A|nr:hypothetical protein [Terracoccus luteus]